MQFSRNQIRKVGAARTAEYSHAGIYALSTTVGLRPSPGSQHYVNLAGRPRQKYIFNSSILINV